ncbi:histidine phosphatase family protein [Bacteriovorax sp. Seq25_V]|uniref:histidine phosphatase family protein n=1 Tax=Bacteriovorax sp. Seq25_V TaxID=1201288 RepID=UPI00038A093F|nr:histidine phosphatase family protein [Bacteriovorax sp. Seq25_V]EQC46101.1 histidine phosphatase superfamily (branch 1) [Bacteriovorax sp. Seq25_V]
MIELYVFRHGQTDWNKAGRLQGHSDIALNDTGISQAKKLAMKFEKIKIDHIFSSDLIRAKSTAELALGELIPMTLHPGLREVNIGDYEGLAKDELPQTFNLDAWLARGENLKFPNGESKEEHRDRIVQTIKEIVASTEHKSIAISTHGGSMARLLEYCENYHQDIILENCALAKVTLQQDQFLFECFL